MKETCYLSSKKLLNMCTVQCFKDEMTEFCTCTYKRYICVWEYSSETKWIADLKFLIGLIVKYTFNCYEKSAIRNVIECEISSEHAIATSYIFLLDYYTTG